MVLSRTSGSDETGEPGNDNGRVIRDLQERQDWEDHHHGEAVDRNTFAGGAGENSRGSALQCQTIQCTDSTVGIGVSSGEDGRQQETKKCEHFS